MSAHSNCRGKCRTILKKALCQPKIASVGFVWHPDTLFQPNDIFVGTSLVEKNYAYNKVKRATDIISHSSSERRSIFNASWWSKFSSVTGCFTSCKCAHSATVELENAIQFRLHTGINKS